jgi:hypothetical protein
MGDDRAPNFGGEEPATPPPADALSPTARELRNRSLRNLPPLRRDDDGDDPGATGTAGDTGTSTDTDADRDDDAGAAPPP